MKLGIVGLPNVGKSTLFNSLTKAGAESANYPFCTIDPNVGVVAVPDDRLDKLAALYNSAKITPAVIEFVDIAGLVKGASKGEGLGNQFLANIREVDAIVHVVRCFEDSNIVHVDGSIDPIRDIETINLELIFSDIEVLDRRLAKQKRASYNNKDIAKECDLLERLKAFLEEGTLAKNFECQDEDEEAFFINALNPDVVIYAGDIFDNDYDALDDEAELKEILHSINAKYGSYAVFGNHDVTETLVGGFSTASSRKAFRDSRMESFLDEAGINIMLDEVTTIADGKINLIGRLDGEKAGDGTRNRKDLSELIEQCDMSKPVIVINHEPDKLHEAADMGVDVMLSGHTHAGQFFPLTIVQPFAWENYWGIKKIDNMYSVVTSGVGLYGPAMRVGTDSEVMSVEINFR